VSHQSLERELLQGEFQQDRIAFQKVETGAGDSRTGFEIDQIKSLAQLHVIERLEIESWNRRLAAVQLSAGIFPAMGRLRVRQVGHQFEQRIDFCVQSVMLLLRSIFAGSQCAPLGDSLLALCVINRTTDRLADFIGLPIEVFCFQQQRAALAFQRHKPIDIDRDMTPRTVFFDYRWVLQHESPI
jgi:hypothetical protein